MVARRASTVLNFWSGNNKACVRGGAAVHMLAIIGKVTDFGHKYVKGFGIFLDLDSHSLHAAHPVQTLLSFPKSSPMASRL